MKFQLTSPCSSCPFRSDITFYLYPARAQEILDAILVHDQTFACHKTTTHDEEGNACHAPDEQHCAGALILAERLGIPNQLTRIMARLGLYDRTKLHMDAPVFLSPASMLTRMRGLHRLARKTLKTSRFSTRCLR